MPANTRCSALNLHRKVSGTSVRSRKHAPLSKDSDFLRASPHARLFGYARVSTEEQNLDVQVTALRAAGVEDANLYVEKISAVNAKRPIFGLMMKMLEQGDTLLFHSLSRMGREAAKVIVLLQSLTDQGVIWRSLTEPHLDSSTAIGRFMVTMTGAKDQLERDQVVERTVRGMAERKRQGMWLGRKPKVSDADAQRMMRMRNQGLTGEQIAARFPHLKIKASTVYARTNALMRASR
jgi:DNA invertase Pin-like site-specific DNA recombinase